jgi:hypothetical protein
MVISCGDSANLALKTSMATDASEPYGMLKNSAMEAAPKMAKSGAPISAIKMRAMTMRITAALFLDYGNSMTWP